MPIQTGEAPQSQKMARLSTPSTTRVLPETMEQPRPPAATNTPPPTATPTRTLAADGKAHQAQAQLELTAGATLRPPATTATPVEAVRDQRHSADSGAEAVAAGNRAPQAHAVGAVVVAAEAGEVAAPVVEAGAVVEVSVVEDEDKSRSTGTELDAN